MTTAVCVKCEGADDETWCPVCHGIPPTVFTLPENGVVLDNVEKSFIEQALARANGNQSKAAKLLGISRYALRYRAARFGLIQ